MEKIKNAPEKAEKFMKSGDMFSRAYAVCLHLSQKEKAPYLLNLKTSEGTISVAKRGGVKNDFLIGTQHYQNPIYRLLSYRKIVDKKKIHIYSLNNYALCTGHEAKPPLEFFEKWLKYELKTNGNLLTCGHSESHLILEHVSGTKIQICKKCGERNAFSDLMKYTMVPSFDKEFQLYVELPLDYDYSISIPRQLKNEYFNGKITDSKLINEYEKEMKKHLKENTIFVINNKTFENYSEFLNNFELENDLKEILLAIKPDKGILISTNSQKKLLEILWNDYRSQILNHLGIEDNNEENPERILHDYIANKKKVAILKDLPDFSKAGKIQALLDKLAKEYIVHGRNYVIRSIDNNPQKEHLALAITYGFLKALQAEKGKEWKFKKEEKELGTYLSEYIIKLINEKDRYKENFNNILGVCGIK